jgi:Mg/Co/Ni transporter MgtE
VTRREVNALLAYKEDAAGGLMNPRFARLRPDMAIDEAISYLAIRPGMWRASIMLTLSMKRNTCSAL